MRKSIVVIAGILLLNLAGCGKQPEQPEIYNGPGTYPSACYFDGELVFPLEDRLYRLEEGEQALTLQVLEGEKGEAAIGYYTYLYPDTSDKDKLYLAAGGQPGFTVESLSKDMEKTLVYEEKNESQCGNILIWEDMCYYTKNTPEGIGGMGATLKQADLKGEKEPSVLYVWGEYGTPMYMEHIYKGGPYFIATFPGHDMGWALWVYDTNAGEMIVEENKELAGAAYYDGRLYFVDESRGAIAVYDLENQKKLDTAIPIKDFVSGMTLACDNEYIYVSPGESYLENPASSCIQVYNYEGEPVDTIDLSQNADAQRLGLYDNPLVCRFFCSTEEYLFIGEPARARGLFYVDKAELGKEDLELHTLYLGKNE